MATRRPEFTPATWDHPFITGASPAWPLLPPLRRSTARCEARTRFVNTGADAATARHIGDELRRRRTWWRARLARRSGGRTQRGLARVFQTWLAAEVIAIALIFGLAMLGGGPVPPLTIAIGGGSALLGVLLIAGLRANMRAQIVDALQECRCPDCGYDLRSVPSETLDAGSEPVSMGPERCPECGVSWPLIPGLPR